MNCVIASIAIAVKVRKVQKVMMAIIFSVRDPLTEMVKLKTSCPICIANTNKSARQKNARPPFERPGMVGLNPRLTEAFCFVARTARRRGQMSAQRRVKQNRPRRSRGRQACGQVAAPQSGGVSDCSRPNFSGSSSASSLAFFRLSSRSAASALLALTQREERRISRATNFPSMRS